MAQGMRIGLNVGAKTTVFTPHQHPRVGVCREAWVYLKLESFKKKKKALLEKIFFLL